MATQLSSADFAQQVANAQGVALVDFWAEWCPPCRALTPTIEQLAEESAGSALVAKVNVDEARDVAQKYNVASIPTVIVFQDGQEIERLVGLRQIQEYRAALQRAGV